MHTKEILKRGTSGVLVLMLSVFQPSVAFADAVKNDITTLFNKEVMAFETQKPIVENDIIYVPLKDICEKVGAYISWSEKSSRADVTYKHKHISLKTGSPLVTVNGSTEIIPATLLKDGRTMVALSFLARQLDINYQFSFDTQTLLLKNYGDFPTKTELAKLLEPKKEAVAKYSDEDLYWLSRIVQAEARGESYNAKVAVANVVLNRTKSAEFPSTIKGVIFDTKYGVQFTPIADGAIVNTPSEESVRAARDALEGKIVAKSVLYFLNPRSAKSSWTTRNRQFAFAIENHNFYY